VRSALPAGTILSRLFLRLRLEATCHDPDDDDRVCPHDRDYGYGEDVENERYMFVFSEEQYHDLSLDVLSRSFEIEASFAVPMLAAASGKSLPLRSQGIYAGPAGARDGDGPYIFRAWVGVQTRDSAVDGSTWAARRMGGLEVELSRFRIVLEVADRSAGQTTFDGQKNAVDVKPPGWQLRPIVDADDYTTSFRVASSSGAADVFTPHNPLRLR